ncbi:atpase aaa : [Gemmata massiliana]|uniref:Atpase aaa n=1 Tax=Gemmata massiliana TaxID=1210884 RepID=A0A6P2CRD4_9BACT|nr:hypothetical protein [Gemmata massiliana]VTR91459.1 atpase aaa : [Gemmata massiliana]
MRAPQLVIVETDGWIGRLLGDLAADSSWLVRGTRSADSAIALVRTRRPSVLVVQVDPADDKSPALELISDANRLCPDVPVIAISDVKFNDADRVAWTSALFDLGVRYALFPPLTRPVLEDVVSGLMGAATVRAGIVIEPVPQADKPKPKPRLRRAEPVDDVIDLADEEAHE